MKDHLERLVAGHSPLRGRNLTREYLQARILGSLQRAGAMTALAFQGGTCLRFLFGLPRYSEDLDFAREREPAGYSLRGGLRAIRSDLSAEGYEVDLRVRERAAVHSALVRFPGILHAIGLSPRPAEVLAVKIEIDIRPPAGATTDISVVARHGDPYARIGADRDARVSIEWGVTDVPETFIVDGAGMIRYKYTGPLTPQLVDDEVLPRLREFAG